MNINIVTIVSKHFNHLLRKHLDEHGSYDITQCDNYVEGLHLIKEITPDIVIIDLDIERLYAISVLKEILLSSPNIKIMTLSDSYEDDFKIELFNLGIDNFISKPYQLTSFWQELDKIKESLKEELQDTTFSTTSNESYYTNLNLSIRNPLEHELNQNSSKTNIENFDKSLDITDALLNNQINNTNNFEFDFDNNNRIEDSQLDVSNCNEIKRNGYLGLPIYLDRETIYREPQDDEENSHNYKASRSVLKGVFKK